MATGTSKTLTAFQIIWQLWKSGLKKRILFLADRNFLVDQARTNDFKPFGSAMTQIQNHKVDKSYEIYLSLYQSVTGTEEADNVYKQFSPDFFDLVVIECHRSIAREASLWHAILDYFRSATQIGLTATPKETKDASNISYFGESIYTYSLKQGIKDGFLAPYRVIRVDLDKELTGWQPTRGMVDDMEQQIEDRIYSQRDFDKVLVLNQRTKLVAQRVVNLLEATAPYSKTIAFCEDSDHPERMRSAIVNANPSRVLENPKYVQRITGDNPEGKAQLWAFTDPEERYPVIATTSKLLTTGVDAKTCRYVVIDQCIESMAEFKQIIGRGTRLHEESGKTYFTIVDFKKATEQFAAPAFDGKPVVIYEPLGDCIAPPADWQDDEGDLDPAQIEREGLLIEAFEDEVGADLDPFDLICHVVFGQPPLTRKERAGRVRKRDVFAKYGEKARRVLFALLDKYADQGMAPIKRFDVLKVRPFDEIGTAVELVRLFGGKEQYLKAVRDLEQALYAPEGTAA